MGSISSMLGFDDLMEENNFLLADKYVENKKKFPNTENFGEHNEKLKNTLRSFGLNPDANDVFHVLLPLNQEPSNFLDFESLNIEEAFDKLGQKVKQAKKDGHRKFFIFVKDGIDSNFKTMVITYFAMKYNVSHYKSRSDPRCQVLILRKHKSLYWMVAQMFALCLVIVFVMMLMMNVDGDLKK